MMIILHKTYLSLSIVLLLAACSAAKLESRLEANPQCKDVINPKTGALMPCPVSDKAFYKEVALAPTAIGPITNANATTITAITATNKTSPSSLTAEKNSTQNDCKAQIHKKTGSTLPCLPQK